MRLQPHERDGPSDAGVADGQWVFGCRRHVFYDWCVLDDALAMRGLGSLVSTLLLLSSCDGCALLSRRASRDGQNTEKLAMTADVVAWVREAPFDNPIAMQATPDFSYDSWLARGRAMPEAVPTLIQMLEREDLRRPSGDGMRVAYALGWIGDKRKQGVVALLRALKSSDVALRVEAASALGRQGDGAVLQTLETLMTDEKEDVNVRANACISIGRIGSPSSEPLLRRILADANPFLATCATEALRLLGAKS
jgi:hypothetical protein